MDMLKKVIKKFLDVTYASMRPDMLNGFPTHRVVDEYINYVIDNDLVIALDSTLAEPMFAYTTDGTEIFIKDWFGAYGSIKLKGKDEGIKYIPYIRTRAKLQKYLYKKFQERRPKLPDGLQDVEILYQGEQIGR